MTRLFLKWCEIETEPCFRLQTSAWGPKCQNVALTSVRGVEGGERDHEEGGGVFASIDQVREGPLGVSVTPQALDEAEPGGQTLDDGAQAVRVAVTQRHRFCERRKDTLEPLSLPFFISSDGFPPICPHRRIQTLRGEAHYSSRLATVSFSLAA